MGLEDMIADIVTFTTQGDLILGRSVMQGYHVLLMCGLDSTL